MSSPQGGFSISSSLTGLHCLSQDCALQLYEITVREVLDFIICNRTALSVTGLCLTVIGDQHRRNFGLYRLQEDCTVCHSIVLDCHRRSP